MKNTILILFAILTVSVAAQDFEPTQHPFTFKGINPYYLSADSSYFKQTNMIIGWHWGGPRKISDALFVNQRDKSQSSSFDVNEFVDNCNVLLQHDDYTHAVDSKKLNARAIQFEPTLEINSLEPDKLVKRTGDTTSPVFGFKLRRGRTEPNNTNINFNRRIFEGDSLFDQVILSEPWPDNKIYLAYGSKKPSDEVLDTFLCRTMYFSINLRRNDDVMDNADILKIELPYWLGNGDSNSIQFAEKPMTGPSDTITLSNGRGCIRNLEPASGNKRELIITRDMIPPNNRDITISAWFTLFGGNPLTNNPELKTTMTPEDDKIDKIGIKITYLDTASRELMIDWVRLETPHAQRFLRGEYDESFIDSVQSDLNRFSADSFSTRGIRLFRYNTIVEGSLFNWIAERYFNKLIGNVSTCEVGILYPEHHEYYVNSPDRWFGVFSTYAHISAPYSRDVYISMKIPNDTGVILLSVFFSFPKSTDNLVHF